MSMLDRLRGRVGCVQADRLLQQHLDGELDPGLARRVERHLQACGRCGPEAATYLRIKWTLAQVALPMPRVGEEPALARLRALGEELAVSGPRPGRPGERR